MDLYDPTRFRNNTKTISSTERFLGVPPHAPPLQSRIPSAADELIEDDVVFSLDDRTEPSSPTLNHTPTPIRRKGFASGILAALPGNDASPHFFQKAPVSVSVPVPSSSRPIPRPPADRTPPSLGRFHQSAPVNVPVMSPGMMKAARRRQEFDEDDGDAAAEEEEGEMLPPHEIVARNSAALAFSVLEGAGRTLKGRDLRQVRNAVLRQTGFL